MTPKKLFAGIATASVLGAGGVTATDAAINPYDTVGQTLQEASVSTIPDAGENKVILDKTRPKITLSKFGGELQMGVTYTGMQATGDRKFLSSEVDWRDANQTMQVVPLAASSTMEDGGYEINIVLNSKPASNVFNFSIDGADQLDFFYQPPLTDEEIKEGAQRPENVVGSYAVYYKEHANHVERQTNYATGKAYHIYRPLVTDAKGAQAWADLSYADGVLTITVPPSFLDTAVYPMKVDPTIGITAIGASSGTANTDRVYSINKNNTTDASGGTVSQIQFYANKQLGDQGSAAAIYSGTTLLSPQSGAVTINSTTAQWWVYTFTGPTLSASTAYRPSIIFDAAASNGITNYFDTGVSGNSAQAAPVTYPTWPAPITWIDNNSIYSIYATYAAGAAAATPHSTTVLQNSTTIINNSTLIIQ